MTGLDSSTLVNCDLESAEELEEERETSSWLQEGEEGDNSLLRSSSE